MHRDAYALDDPTLERYIGLFIRAEANVEVAIIHGFDVLLGASRSTVKAVESLTQSVDAGCSRLIPNEVRLRISFRSRHHDSRERLKA
jgi:hypothetical protein